MASRRMIKALLATTVVVKSMTVSILLLILFSSPYLSSSNSISGMNHIPADIFMQEVIFNANFEDNSGDNNWTLTSSATDGNWVNDSPSPYFTGNTRMEIDAIEGSQSLVTGSINNQDVDGGPTIVRSPIISLDAQAESIDISFSYYFSHFTNSSTADNLIISIHSATDDSELLRLVQEDGAPSSRDAVWQQFEGSLLSLAGDNIYIQASSQDVSNPSKVEAAIDQLMISQQLPSDMCETLISDDFEQGYGNWIDGGSDATRINNSDLASSGVISVRLRDNTNSSVITSGPHDLSDVEQLQLSFHFVAVSFENDEDFWFQTSSDGVNFTIEEDWIHQVDFENNEPRFESLTLNGPFSSTTYFRFRADATANGDMVFIDDILIESCQNTPEVLITLSDTSFCNGSSITLQPDVEDPNSVIVSHEWDVLPSSTASGFVLSGATAPNLSISATDAIPGSIDLRYTVRDNNGIVASSEVTVFLLGVDPCMIETAVDSLCSGTTITLDATSIFDVLPDSGVIPASNSGEGMSILHEIIGVQAPEGVLVTITLPTWDDHFDEIILNGNQIIPRVFQPDSWNDGGMQTERPWLPNVFGLPRSIITITSDEVRYFSTLTVTSTELTEVFPTNWVTTPQNFVVGTNTLHFGIQNTQGPVSGSWIVDAQGLEGYSYVWSTGDTTAMIEVAPEATTTYGVVITSPNGCVSSCERTIYVVVPEVSLSDVTIDAGEVIQVQPTISGNSGSSLSYQWRLISDGNTGIDVRDTDSEVLTIDGSAISNDGQEQIELITTNDIGCSDIDTMLVSVVGPIEFNCALVTNFFNEQQFSWGFGIQNTAGEDVDVWQARIFNADYELDPNQITNNNLFVHTQIDNGDGTYDHVFTGTGGIPAFGGLPNFEWPGVNFGGPISSDGIEFRCDGTPVEDSCELNTTFFNEQQFAWGFGVQNTSGDDIDAWQATILNADYALDANQITNNNLFVHTQIDNGDGTYDHVFTGTSGIPAFGGLPNFEWPGVNFGGPISSDGIEFRCDGTIVEESCELNTTFFNEQQFSWGFGIQNTSGDDIDAWQATILNADYTLDANQITNNNLFVHTQIDNGDGTYDHVFTGIDGIPAFGGLPNFEWPVVNFGGSISSDGIEFRCDGMIVDLCADMGTVITEDTTICASESTQVQPTIVGDLGPMPSYQWNLISDGSSGLTLSNTSSEILTLNAFSVTETGEEQIELVVVNSNGCTAIDTMLLTVGISTESDIDYVGCQGDGYGIIVNDVLYNETNPTGVEIITSVQGCDSIINVNLVFNEPAMVEAGMLPFSACSATGQITLSDLGAFISGGSNTGLWTTMGDGTFDVGGVFNVSGSASVYLLGPQDIENGEVILTLTSTDPPGPCEPVADAVLILISDITCSQFPWAGN